MSTLQAAGRLQSSFLYFTFLDHGRQQTKEMSREGCTRADCALCQNHNTADIEIAGCGHNYCFSHAKELSSVNCRLLLTCQICLEELSKLDRHQRDRDNARKCSGKGGMSSLVKDAGLHRSVEVVITYNSSGCPEMVKTSVSGYGEKDPDNEISKVEGDVPDDSSQKQDTENESVTTKKYHTRLRDSFDRGESQLIEEFRNFKKSLNDFSDVESNEHDGSHAISGHIDNVFIEGAVAEEDGPPPNSSNPGAGVDCSQQNLSLIGYRMPKSAGEYDESDAVDSRRSNHLPNRHEPVIVGLPNNILSASETESAAVHVMSTTDSTPLLTEDRIEEYRSSYVYGERFTDQQVNSSASTSQDVYEDYPYQTAYDSGNSPDSSSCISFYESPYYNSLMSAHEQPGQSFNVEPLKSAQQAEPAQGLSRPTLHARRKNVQALS